MFFELIAAIALGVGAGGVAYLARRLSGGALPSFIIPVAAGAGMLSFAVWSEYSWFDRTRAGLPDGFSVIATHNEPSLFRPWTYALPFVSRFVAVDEAGAMRNDKAPGQVLTEVYVFARHVPPAKKPMVVDCLGVRRADVARGIAFDGEGAIVGADWRPLEAEDPLLKTLCLAS